MRADPGHRVYGNQPLPKTSTLNHRLKIGGLVAQGQRKFVVFAVLKFKSGVVGAWE